MNIDVGRECMPPPPPLGAALKSDSIAVSWKRYVIDLRPENAYDHPPRTRPGGYRDHGLVDHRTRSPQGAA